MNDLISEYRSSHPNSQYSDTELIYQFGKLNDIDGRFNSYPGFLQDLATQRAAYSQATQPSLGEDFASGAASGAQSLLATGQGALAAASKFVGAEGAKDYYLEKSQANEQAAAKNQPSVPQWSDVHDWDSFTHWLSGAAGNLLPNLAEMGITGLAGAAAGASAGTAVGPEGTALGGITGLTAGITKRLAVKSLLKKFAEEGLADSLAPEVASTVKSQLTSLAEKGAVRNIAPETEKLLTQESKAIGSNFGNHIAQGLNFYAQSAGGIYNDLTQNKNVDPDTAVNTALLGGFAASVPAQFLPSYVGSKLFSGVKGATLDEAKNKFYQYLSNTASEAVKTVPGGIASMDLQQLATTAAEKYATGAAWTPDDWKNLENTSVTGAFMGVASAPLAALGGGGSLRKPAIPTENKNTPPPLNIPLDSGVMKQVGLDINTPQGKSTADQLQAYAQQDLDGTLPVSVKNSMSAWAPELQTQYNVIKGTLQDEIKKSTPSTESTAAGTMSPAGIPGNSVPGVGANPTDAGTPAPAVAPTASPDADGTSAPSLSANPSRIGVDTGGSAGVGMPPSVTDQTPAPTPVLEAPASVPKSVADKLLDNAAKMRKASVGDVEPPKKKVAPVEVSPEPPVSLSSEQPPSSEQSSGNLPITQPNLPTTTPDLTAVQPLPVQAGDIAGGSVSEKQPAISDSPRQLESIKYEGGKADGFAQSVPPNANTVHYGPRGQEEDYIRTDRKDEKGRAIFALQEHPLLSSIGFNSLQPGQGVQGRGRRGMSVAATPPFIDIPADAQKDAHKLAEVVTSNARKTGGKNTDTNRATAMLAPDGQVHVLPTYYTQTGEKGKVVRLAPLPGESKGGTLADAIKKGYSPLSSIYLRDTVNALDPKQTHSFPTQDAYERQIAQPARERLAAAKSTAAAVESHITGAKGSVGGGTGNPGMAEASQGAYERPEISDELGAALHSHLTKGATPTEALERIAKGGNIDHVADLRNLITQLVEQGHSRQEALDYVKDQIGRAYKNGGTSKDFVKALSESAEGRAPGHLGGSGEPPHDSSGQQAIRASEHPESPQPSRVEENPAGKPGSESKGGDQEPDSSQPLKLSVEIGVEELAKAGKEIPAKVVEDNGLEGHLADNYSYVKNGDVYSPRKHIPSYGEKYIKEQGVEGAMRRIDYLRKIIQDGTASQGAAQESDNIAKAIKAVAPDYDWVTNKLKSSGDTKESSSQPGLAPGSTMSAGVPKSITETRQSITAPSIESTPSTQQSYAHVTQTLTQAGVPVAVHQALFASLVHDVASTDHRPVAGGVYDRAAKTVTIAIQDAAKPTTEDLRTLFAEAFHHVFASESQDFQNRVTDAIGNMSDAELGARDYSKSANPGIQAEERLESAISRSLVNNGFDPIKSDSLAKAVVRFVKDLYYKTSMALQRAILGPDYTNGAIAQKYFQNRVESFLARDQNTLSWIDRLGATKVSQSQRGLWRNPGTTPLFETLGENNQPTYDHVPDESVAAFRFNSDNLRFSLPPDADKETRTTAAEMLAALANHGGDIIERASKLPVVDEIAKSLDTDPAKLIQGTLRLPDAESLKSALTDWKETDGAPTQYRDDIKTDQFKSEDIKATVNRDAAINTFKALGAINGAVANAYSENAELEDRHDKLADAVDLKRRNYLDFGAAKREMVGWVRGAIPDIYSRATGASKRMGILEQQLRGLDPSGNIKDYASIFKHLHTGDQLKGENLGNLLEKMALDPKIDFNKPIGEIRADMQGNLEYRDWLDNSKESRAVLATAVAFAKTHESTMVNLEMRRMENAAERQRIATDLAGLKTEKADLSKSIPRLARTATLEERARAAYRAENNKVRSIARQIEDNKLKIKLGEAVAPVFHATYSDLATKLKLSGDFTWGHGAIWHEPPSAESTPDEVAASRRILQIETNTGHPTSPDDLIRGVAKQTEWLNAQDAKAKAGDASAKGIIYRTIAKERDELAMHCYFNPDQKSADRFAAELKFMGEGKKAAQALGVPSAQTFERRHNIFATERGRYKDRDESWGFRIVDLKSKLMKLLPESLSNKADILEHHILDPYRGALEGNYDLMEQYADRPDAMRDAANRRAQNKLMQMSDAKAIIGSNQEQFFPVLRKLVDLQSEISDFNSKRSTEGVGVLDPKLKLTNIDTGEQEAGWRAPEKRGVYTFSRKISGDLRLTINALREKGWNSDEAGKSNASSEFNTIGDLHAQNPAAVDSIEAKYFHDPVYGDQIINHFVRDLVESDKRPIWDAPSPDGETRIPADPQKLRSQWEASNGSIRKFAEGLYDAYTAERGEHAQTKSEYVQDVFTALSGLSAQLDRLIPYESKSTPPTLRGAIENPLIHARTLPDLPSRWFDYHSYDERDLANVNRAISFQKAYGVDGKAGQNDIDAMKREVRRAKDMVKMAQNEFLAKNPNGTAKDADKYLIQKYGKEQARQLQNLVKNSRVPDDIERDLSDLFRRNNSPDGTVRLLVRSANALGTLMTTGGGSGIVQMSKLFDLPFKFGASRTTLSTTGGIIRDFSREMVGSITQALGFQLFRESDSNKIFNEDGYFDPGRDEHWNTSFVPLQGERRPAQIARMVSEGLQVGIGKKEGARYTILRPGHMYTTVSMAADKAVTTNFWRMVSKPVADGVEHLKSNPAYLPDPAYKIDTKALGYTGAEADTFNRLSKEMNRYGVNFNQVVRDAIQRDDGNLISREQRARLYEISTSEIANDGDVNTTPAWMYNNSIATFCLPLLRWGIRRTAQITDIRLDTENRMAFSAVARGMAGLAVMAGGGMGVSMLLQQYYQSIVGKKTNLRPVLGNPNAQEEALAVMENLNRIGSFGLFGELANSVAGTGGGGDNRMLSVDDRVVAIQSINNIIGAAQAFAHQDFNADYIHVMRPLFSSMGGAGLLQYMDIANNALGLDNAEARQTARVNAENYLRVVGRQMELDVRKPDGGGSNPTPEGAALTEMELAAYLNNPADFQAAWKDAIQKAKENGHDDPAQYVRSAFAARHPLRAVFKTAPSIGDYNRLLNNLPDSGRQDVDQAVRLFNAFGAKLGIKPYDGKPEPTIKPNESLTRSDPYALRKAAMAGLGQTSIFQ